MKFCPYCGTQLEDAMEFCHKCGKSQDYTENQETEITALENNESQVDIPTEEPSADIKDEPQKPKKKRTWLRVLLIIVGVVVTLGIALFVGRGIYADNTYKKGIEYYHNRYYNHARNCFEKVGIYYDSLQYKMLCDAHLGELTDAEISVFSEVIPAGFEDYHTVEELLNKALLPTEEEIIVTGYISSANISKTGEMSRLKIFIVGSDNDVYNQSVESSNSDIEIFKYENNRCENYQVIDVSSSKELSLSSLKPHNKVIVIGKLTRESTSSIWPGIHIYNPTSIIVE